MVPPPSPPPDLDIFREDAAATPVVMRQGAECCTDRVLDCPCPINIHLNKNRNRTGVFCVTKGTGRRCADVRIRTWWSVFQNPYGVLSTDSTQPENSKDANLVVQRC